MVMVGVVAESSRGHTYKDRTKSGPPDNVFQYNTTFFGKCFAWVTKDSEPYDFSCSIEITNGYALD